MRRYNGKFTDVKDIYSAETRCFMYGLRIRDPLWFGPYIGLNGYYGDRIDAEFKVIYPITNVYKHRLCDVIGQRIRFRFSDGDRRDMSFRIAAKRIRLRPPEYVGAVDYQLMMRFQQP